VDADASGIGQLVRGSEPTSAPGASDVNTPSTIAAQNQPQQLAATGLPPDTTIDILVLYTEAVRSALDSPGANVKTKLLAQDGVDQIQQALATSVPLGQPPLATVNLVAAIEVTRTLNGNLGNDLVYLQGNSEPVGLRNFWAADVVMYLTDSGGTGVNGLSNQPNDGFPAPGASFAQFALSGIQFNCALATITAGATCYDYYVFAHEFGHLFGANHNQLNSPYPYYPNPPYPPPGPVEPWAFGHWANERDGEGIGGHRTLMSYLVGGCHTPCPRILYYSNSAVQVGTFYTGVPNTQENARVIAEFAPVTALYRTGVTRIFYGGFEWGQ